MSGSFTDNDIRQTAWMIDALGDEIEYKPQGYTGPPLKFKALVDRNAEQQPAYGDGRVRPLSSRHHHFTFMRQALPDAPKRGDLIDLDGDRYTVDHVNPDDEPWWTVIAR